MTSSVEKVSEYAPGVTPCGHRLVVYPMPVERTTASGIIIHDVLANREEMAQIEAVVVSVGPSCWADQPVKDWAKPGDTVLIAKFAGMVRKGWDDKSYRVINDLDVVCIVQEKAA